MSENKDSCFNCCYYLGEVRYCQKYRYLFPWFVAKVTKCTKWKKKGTESELTQDIATGNIVLTPKEKKGTESE